MPKIEARDGGGLLASQAPPPPQPLQIDATIEFVGRSGRVSWTTNAETNLLGFNVVAQTSSGRKQINGSMIPCTECVTGMGESYSFSMSRHRSGWSVFIEAVYTDGTTELFGPARRNMAVAVLPR